jgi:hypothetical protein
MENCVKESFLNLVFFLFYEKPILTIYVNVLLFSSHFIQEASPCASIGRRTCCKIDRRNAQADNEHSLR